MKIINGKRIESAMREPPRNAMRPKAEPKKIYPKHTGGGWYELSNGEKVQGKDNAIQAEKELR